MDYIRHNKTMLPHLDKSERMVNFMGVLEINRSFRYILIESDRKDADYIALQNALDEPLFYIAFDGQGNHAINHNLKIDRKYIKINYNNNTILILEPDSQQWLKGGKITALDLNKNNEILQDKKRQINQIESKYDELIKNQNNG